MKDQRTTIREILQSTLDLPSVGYSSSPPVPSPPLPPSSFENARMRVISASMITSCRFIKNET